MIVSSVRSLSRVIFPSSHLLHSSTFRLLPNSVSASVSRSVLSSTFAQRNMSDKAAPVCNDEFCLPASSPATANSTAQTNSSGAAAGSSSGGKKVVKIDITSDTVCPWCFVGKRRLEKALKQVDSSKVDVQIQWHPFQLNPNSPEVSVSKLQFYMNKFGPRTSALMSNMKQVGREENIDFQYSEKGRVGNTLKSHQLISLALELGGAKLQNELVERLFKDYFEREEDITKEETLLAAAKSVGINEQQAKEALKSATVKKNVEKEVESAYEQQISGVPHFTIDGKYSVGGAQDPAVFLNLFKKMGITTAAGAL